MRNAIVGAVLVSLVSWFTPVVARADQSIPDLLARLALSTDAMSTLLARGELAFVEQEENPAARRPDSATDREAEEPMSSRRELRCTF